MMDDPISRQEAIDHWRAIIDATDEDSIYNMGFVDGLEFCINHLSTMPSTQSEVTEEEVKEYCRKRSLSIIDSALLKKYTSAQTEPRWIPCSERLPEESGLYIVTHVGRWSEPAGTRYYNIGADGGFWSGHPGYKVLAWMPLPEPYVGEQDEEGENR